MLPLFHLDFLANVAKSGSSRILHTRYRNLVSDRYKKLIRVIVIIIVYYAAWTAHKKYTQHKT